MSLISGNFFPNSVVNNRMIHICRLSCLLETNVALLWSPSFMTKFSSTYSGAICKLGDFWCNRTITLLFSCCSLRAVMTRHCNCAKLTDDSNTAQMNTTQCFKKIQFKCVARGVVEGICRCSACSVVLIDDSTNEYNRVFQPIMTAQMNTTQCFNQ